MPSAENSILSWIATQQNRMIERVVEWANINSYSRNALGVAKVAHKVHNEFNAFAPISMGRHELSPAISLNARAQTVPTSLGPAVTFTKRSDAPVRVLLNIHLDTVYPPDSPFQTVREESGHLIGPGVADAKGGLAVLLTALEALERSENANRIGWQVLLNPDEEIGSPGSAPLLIEAAKSNHFGLLFEPALPDGAIVDRRRGSGNFSLIVRGRAAHAGRDFASGRSALLAAAGIALKLHSLNESLPGVTLNIGSIDGGSPANVVPDLAICRINIRTTQPADEPAALAVVNQLVSELNNDADGITAELDGRFSSPPKIPDDRTLRLLDAILSCGRDLGLNIATRASGGVSDGNRLAAAGLPNIDSLGPCGDRIHSPEEYLIPESLVERAQLTALLLLKIASGDIDPAPFCR